MALTWTKEADELWRDYNTTGVPASGKFSPVKADLVVWGGEVETYLGQMLRKSEGGTVEGDVTFEGTITLSDVAPYYFLYETDQASGSRGSSIGSASGNITFHAREDNGTVQTELATIYRNGTGMDIGATPASNGGWIMTTGASSTKFYRAGTSANADLLQLYSLVHADPSYTEVFKVQNDGDTYNYNGTYGSLSDSRLKENIVDANPQLDDVLAMQVRNFNRIGDELKQIGFIAQELQAVKPGLVEKGVDGYLQVKYSVLVPILVKAIQELEARVAQLEAN